MKLTKIVKDMYNKFVVTSCAAGILLSAYGGEIHAKEDAGDRAGDIAAGTFAGTIILGLGYGILSSTFFHHPSRSRREEVRKYSSDKIKPKYRFDVKDKDSAPVKKIQDLLENVPDIIQEIGNKHGAIVVITDKPIDDGKAEGMYYITTKEMHVELKRFPGMYSMISVELHEYGHMIDHALDWPSDNDDFIKIYEKSKEIKVLGNRMMGKHEMTASREFFAECFAKYYFSDSARKNFNSIFPEAHNYIRNLEEKLVKSYK